MRLSVIFDNYALGGFEAAWGLSVAVESDRGERLLFDGGSSGAIWQRNAARLGFSLNNFDHFFVSHFHWDHLAAVTDAVYLTSDKHFLITEGFSRVWTREAAGRHQVSLVREPYRFGEELFSLGVLEGDGIFEHSLAVFNKRGEYALLVGCSHAGVLRIVDRALSLFGKPPHLLLGGFHLFAAPREVVYETAAGLLQRGVHFAAPSHCSGEVAREVFADVFGKRLLEVGAGAVIEI